MEFTGDLTKRAEYIRRRKIWQSEWEKVEAKIETLYESKPIDYKIQIRELRKQEQECRNNINRYRSLARGEDKAYQQKKANST
jgi:hypothetical protein